jgi:hypothetical protein
VLARAAGVVSGRPGDRTDEQQGRRTWWSIRVPAVRRVSGCGHDAGTDEEER